MNKRKSKEFLYEFEGGGLVKVFAQKRPSLETIPRSGAWLLHEWSNGSFQMPCFPEVTWGIIKNKMTYIGELKNVIKFPNTKEGRNDFTT